MDGSSGQQTTRQEWSIQSTVIDKSSDDDSDVPESQNVVTDPSDNTVFITTFVPLRLKADDEIIWINEKPSSVFYCRLINFKFAKENKEIVENNYNYYQTTLDKVQLYCLSFKGFSFNVKLDLQCTMIDGKVNYILTGQDASSRCNICGVGPKYVNDLEQVLRLSCNTEFYKFGFPILHSWIRFMEYVLHISYNSDFKKASASGENKKLKAERKEKIQKLLKSKLNLTVDVVKQSAGTTNTGNVSRAFFSKPKEVSEILGIKEELLERLHTVLQVISQKKEICISEFKHYCLDTAQFCVNNYGWYNMPPSVHKVLIHGCDIMEYFDAPISWFSEEAQESSNKVFRKARSEHSRMFQRAKTNEDIMH